MSTKTDQIVKLKKYGNAIKVIADFVNLSQAHVRQVLIRKGLTRKVMSEEEDNLLIAMANRGVDTKDMAATFDRPVRTIQYRLKKLGLSKGKGRPIGKKPSHKWDIPKKSRSL